MKRKTLLLACLLAIVLAGCTSLREDPNAELKAAAEVFSSTVNVLTELKAQGHLSDDEIEDIGAMIHMGEKYLVEWRAAIDAGQRDADIVTAFNVILEKLAKVRSKHNDNR